MSVNPVPAGSHGGVSVYAGMNGSSAVLSAGVPAGAGMPWEDEPVYEGCVNPTTGEPCAAGRAKNSPWCIGHTRSVAKVMSLL